MKNETYDPKEGYNIIAPHYNNWKWQTFWHLNEYPYIEEWCRSLPVGTGLDLGAGSGNNLGCFLEHGHQVTAVDISAEMLKICKQKHLQSVEKGKLICRELDIQNLPENCSYDWIISNRVISHVKHAECIIKIIAAMLKPGGQCFISDVHPLHHYKNTNMSIDKDEICIETYKHSVGQLKGIFLKSNLKIIKCEEIGVKNLCDKNILKKFPQLCSQQEPVFYYFIIQR